jgi:hypothetical protein
MNAKNSIVKRMASKKRFFFGGLNQNVRNIKLALSTTYFIPDRVWNPVGGNVLYFKPIFD